MTCRASRTLELTGVGRVEGQRGTDGVILSVFGRGPSSRGTVREEHTWWEQGPEGPQLWIYWPSLLVRTQVSKPWPRGQI